MAKTAKQKPPMECRTIEELSSRRDAAVRQSGEAVIDVHANTVRFSHSQRRIDIPRADFDKLVRWYTGTEKKARAR